MTVTKPLFLCTLAAALLAGCASTPLPPQPTPAEQEAARNARVNDDMNALITVMAQPLPSEAKGADCVWEIFPLLGKDGGTKLPITGKLRDYLLRLTPANATGTRTHEDLQPTDGVDMAYIHVGGKTYLWRYPSTNARELIDTATLECYPFPLCEVKDWMDSFMRDQFRDAETHLVDERGFAEKVMSSLNACYRAHTHTPFSGED